MRLHRRHVYEHRVYKVVRARVAAGDDEGAVVLVVCKGELLRSLLDTRLSTLGNKVCLDEQAHVFAFSIYRNSVRGRS